MKRVYDLPNLDFLKGFAAVARSMSFTKAAQELYVTQSAISRQIKTLEDQLGVALFIRRPRTLLLTEEGQLLLRAVQEAFSLLQDTTDRIRRQERIGALTVATSPGFASLWLIPRLAQFSELHPGTDVRVSASSQLVDLDRDGIDIAIRNTRREQVPAGVQRLFSESVFPICNPVLVQRKQHPLRSPQDLRHQILLHYDDPTGTWPWLGWNFWLERLGVAELRPHGQMRFSLYDQVIHSALAGHGVAVGRSGLVEHFLRSGDLVAPFGQGTRDEREYFVLLASHAARRPEVQAFVSWLRAAAWESHGQQHSPDSAPAA